MNKTYISYVIQSAAGHIHDFAVVDLPKSQIAIYKDTSGEDVFKWAEQKQLELEAGKKLVLLSHFIIA